MLRGVAFDENGKAMSGMGVAAADYDGDGLPDIFRSNFSDERETLYRNRGGGQFDDVTIAAGIARNTRYVGWGCGFFDFDNDGWKDLLLVNGHVFPEVDRLGIDIHYRDRAILYRNLGGKSRRHLRERRPGHPGASLRARRGLRRLRQRRAGRSADQQSERARRRCLKQTTNPANHWIMLKLAGVRSNRSALGAKVRLTAGGRTQYDEVRSGGSYLSQSDLRLHFGIGRPGAWTGSKSFGPPVCARFCRTFCPIG